MARQNAAAANEGFRRCLRFVHGWLAQADPGTGLIPRNLQRDRDIWNAQDSAADNYPFMVLTAALLDEDLFEGRMRAMLETEARLTPRVGAMPDTWSFSKGAFADPDIRLDRIIFGSSEYVKDGLLPLTEWLGASPWSERMLAILDAIWEHAPVATPFGRIASDNVEVNGEMLQALSRIYWMTGDPRYLEWAVRLGDYYLLGEHHPTKDLRVLRLRDHGCEVVSGLCELYATCHFAWPEKAAAYRAPIRSMLDRILEVGRNEQGLFYNQIDPVAGKPTEGGAGTADTWGYTFNGFYTVYLLDGVDRYREATLRAMKALWPHYRSFKWEGESADGYADSIESALNLLNREPLPEVARWIDSETRVMWGKQQEDGVIEGWHGDGNFARTTIMYCLWKTQGVTVRPWREDLRFGALREDGQLLLWVESETPWEGRICFDEPRHRTDLHLPLDWPRINQFPEWFTVEEDWAYRIEDLETGRVSRWGGVGLTTRAGVPVKVVPGQPLRWRVQDTRLLQAR
ncbi:MAG: hypothetical protein H7A46_02345 [Verrucomicrobiales bacterium]|nr:hypothetical protein [Verrucomicrobiales bacterium]